MSKCKECELLEERYCDDCFEKQLAHYKPLYEGEKLAGLVNAPIRALNDMPINGERELSYLSEQDRRDIEEENERDFEHTFGMDRF